MRGDFVQLCVSILFTPLDIDSLDTIYSEMEGIGRLSLYIPGQPWSSAMGIASAL